MASPLVSEERWRGIVRLLPVPKPRRRRYPGRKPIDDRSALTGIMFVLKMDIAWEDLPHELGCGSGMTYWRWLRVCLAAGVWDQLQARLIERFDPE